MFAAAPKSSSEPHRPDSLGTMIRKFHQEFGQLQRELHQAHQEIDRLRIELFRGRAGQGLPEIDVGALRRSVAFHCHPDRGGSEKLMSELNAIFDFLGRLALEQPQPAVARP